MTKQIALTGATGFVGRHLVRALSSNGYSVKALTRRPQKQIENVTWISGDFENTAALKELITDCDVIINVAGLIKARNLNDFLNGNSNAVRALLNAINSNNTSPHFIQISSLAARYPEISDYAFSKNQGEKHFTDNNLEINWTIVRPPGIYGPEDMETLKIFKLVKSHLTLYPENRENRVSWIHINDLVSAILHLLENPKYYGKILEIDDGEYNGYSHKEFFQIIGDTLNINPIKLTTPRFILKTIGHANDIMGHIFNYVPMLSSKKVNEICHNDWVCNKQDGFQINDWQAKIKLKDGLKETLDWYKNNEYI